MKEIVLRKQLKHIELVQKQVVAMLKIIFKELWQKKLIIK
jgi:hypothetical protein